MTVSIIGRCGRLMAAGTILLLPLVLSAGCGGSSGLPEGPRGTVQGTVTYNGEPVPEGSSVTFIHSETSLPASGTTSANGEYTLRMKGQKQILAGQYSVAVAPPKSEQSPEEAMEAQMQGESTQEDSPFPAKYASPATSELTTEVTEGSNDIPLKLSDGDGSGGNGSNEAGSNGGE